MYLCVCISIYMYMYSSINLKWFQTKILRDLVLTFNVVFVPVIIKIILSLLIITILLIMIIIVCWLFVVVCRLEEEGNINQKLTHERSAAENKIKTLEEQITVNDDNISKVNRKNYKSINLAYDTCSTSMYTFQIFISTCYVYV